MLISALNSGLSGMRANETALDSSAHNVANADTQGFNPQQVSFQENTNGGVIVNLSRGSAIAQQDNSGTDLENEVVQSIQYKAGFDVNAKMVKTADEMLGTLINTKA
ncbi:flagellar basal body rod C-terminal domain-containing protein [Undibacterium griseum]|uniref:flagellar basal body rod C-terminal domain-containing protein n=1 Tax=Undibacterium griseum TaxID=2762295 RepID=UPI001E403058|nr:flagellar basal body rod C-terminal domain-containing protein [Undibacterium griseum]